MHFSSWILIYYMDGLPHSFIIRMRIDTKLRIFVKKRQKLKKDKAICPEDLWISDASRNELDPVFHSRRKTRPIKAGPRSGVGSIKKRRDGWACQSHVCISPRWNLSGCKCNGNVHFLRARIDIS